MPEHRPIVTGQPTRFAREELIRLPQRLIKAGHTWLSPDVTLLENGNERWVLKDYFKRPSLVRTCWGRWVIQRESYALGRLAGLPGIPGLAGIVPPDGLVMECVDGETLPRRGLHDRVGPEFFDLCAELLRQMHARGVAHGDLRRKNILVTPEGKPCLIDFQTALVDGPGFFRSRIFRYMAAVDDWNLLRMKEKSFPGAMREEEQALLNRAPFLLRAARFLRQNVYGPISPKRLRRRLRPDDES